MQADGGLAGAGRALHADRRRRGRRGPARPARAGWWRRCRASARRAGARSRSVRMRLAVPSSSPRSRCSSSKLVSSPAGEAEPAAHGDALRVAGAGLVERAGHRRPPVQHHRLAGVVGHVPPADVVAAAGVVGGGRRIAEVEPAEEQRGGRVVGQLGDPAGQGPAERLGGVRVAGDRRRRWRRAPRRVRASGAARRGRRSRWCCSERAGRCRGRGRAR